jgi:hypothetical protein
VAILLGFSAAARAQSSFACNAQNPGGGAITACFPATSYGVSLSTTAAAVLPVYDGRRAAIFVQNHDLLNKVCVAFGATVNQSTGARTPIVANTASPPNCFDVGPSQSMWFSVESGISVTSEVSMVAYQGTPNVTFMVKDQQ